MGETSKIRRPFATWPSPLSAESIADGRKRFGDLRLDGGDLYWTESVAAEKGRMTIFQRDLSGQAESILSAPYSVGSRAHEYGGAAFTVRDGLLFFSNKSDNALYRRKPTGEVALFFREDDCRFADLQIDPLGRFLIAVREVHLQNQKEPRSSIVLLPLQDPASGRILFDTADFCASPAISPDGRRLAIIAWDHPDMPWDATRLLICDLPDSGKPQWREIAGGPGESIFQPRWRNDNELVYLNDKDGWWNPWLWNGEQRQILVAEMEIGLPQWVFGMSVYDFDENGDLLCAWRNGIAWRMSKVGLNGGKIYHIDVPFTYLDQIRSDGKNIFCWAGSANEPQSLAAIPADGDSWQILRRSMPEAQGSSQNSIPLEIRVPAAGNISVLYYSPENDTYCGLDGAKPPMIVMCHSGPTASVDQLYDPRIQFWTTRGFAVADVNFRGSTGQGRAFREALNGRYGRIDAEDCRAAALHLIDEGFVDSASVFIRGSSSGGFTALSALLNSNLFSGATSLYGISDLEAMMYQTHKFEAHYFDRLIAPFPRDKALYRQLSPINRAAEINCPILLIQGTEDAVVRPEQSQLLFEALAERGLPVAYLELEGEGHGLRQPGNIALALETELSFYLNILMPGSTDFDPVVRTANLSDN